MTTPTEFLPDQIQQWVGSVLLAVGSVLGVRLYNSKVNRDVAKNNAEGNYLEQLSQDRDKWRATAQEQAERIRQLEVDCAVARMEYRLLRQQIKAMDRLIKQFPELGGARPLLFESGPGPLDSRPAQESDFQSNNPDRTG